MGVDNEHPACDVRGQLAALFLGELPGHRAISLNDKITLLTGADTWHNVANPAIGLRPLTISDGPAGVRDLRAVFSREGRGSAAVSALLEPPPLTEFEPDHLVAEPE